MDVFDNDYVYLMFRVFIFLVGKGRECYVILKVEFEDDEFGLVDRVGKGEKLQVICLNLIRMLVVSFLRKKKIMRIIKKINI